METISEMMKKVLLAGVGAVAATTEKSKDILDELVAKGEITVEQGKVLNEELKHNIKETIHRKTADTNQEEDPEEILKKLTPEQIAQLKELLKQKEKEDFDFENSAYVNEDIND